MTQQDAANSRSRRQVLSDVALGVTLGVAGLVTSNPISARDSSPNNPRNATPLWPAPETAQAISPAPPLAALVWNKAAFGPRPGDVEAFELLGGDDNSRLIAWVDYQLNPGVSDTEVDARLTALANSLDEKEAAAFDTIDKSALDLWAGHARNTEYVVRMRPVWQMERLTILRATYSEWQLREVLADFWFNHFNIYGRDFPAYGMMPNYDRELRQHIFGNFGDMLNANAKTASMLYYLDNYVNTWPRPNENYAREVLELHTLGAIENYYGAVDPLTEVGINSKGQRAGYTEIDVFEFAKALTGWGVSDTSYGSPDTGEFLFRPDRHYDDFDQASLKILDHEIVATGGESDVTDVLDYLAGHYGTARYIAWKLCVRFVGDNPSESLVSSTADEFYDRRNDADQLQQVYRHILLSTEFQTTWGEKIRRPIETVVHAMRAVDADLSFRIDHGISNSILNRLSDAGQLPFGYGLPTGYPDEQSMWQGSGALIMSWKAITYMLKQPTVVNLAAQTNAGIPVINDRTPNNIVAFWMDRALGYSLEASLANRIAVFITEIIGGTTDAPVNTDSSNEGEGNYQRMLRAVLGLILMSPDAMRR